MKYDELQGLRGKMGKTTDDLQKQEAQKALDKIAQQQAYQNQITGYTTEQPGFKKGKSGIPKMSAWDNFVPNAIGSLASIYQYLDAASQDIKSPDIYSENPYSSAALQNLASIRINPYNAMRQMYDAERRNRYSLSRTGGLTGGQKYAAQVANSIGTQANIANMLNNIQAQNNQYRAAYNQALINAGEGVAQRRMNANQFDEEMTARAHASKAQQMQAGMRNFMDYLNNYAANEYKRKTGNAMLDLYQQSLDMDEANLEALRNIASRNTTTPSSTIETPTRKIVQSIVIPEYIPSWVGALGSDYLNPKKPSLATPTYTGSWRRGLKNKYTLSL